jgi:phage terminase large subunit GpA-like protein
VLSLGQCGNGSHAIRAFSPTLVTVPFGLLRPARAAGLGTYGQPAVNHRNDLECGIAFFAIWPYLDQCFDDRTHAGKEVALEALAARAERWSGEVPDGVGVLTAGLDVQSDRVEIEVVGWGRDEESWSIAYDVLEGDPDSPDLWREVDAALLETFRREDGRPFTIMAACIDSGGHSTQSMYAFAKERIGRRVWAIKGESARSGQRSPVWPTKKPTRKTKAAYRPVILGVNAAKDAVRNRLALDKPGPGYMHFPHDRDLGYYAQLTSERIAVKEVAGHRFFVWELPPGKANEALDCRVYAYAALCGLVHFGLKLNAFVERAAVPYGELGPASGVTRDGGRGLVSQLV